jgi:ankyrin repeat protein
MLAVEANSTSCIKWLLERGADPKATLKTGWQALHLALRLGHDSCVLMLLQEVGGGDAVQLGKGVAQARYQRRAARA